MRKTGKLILIISAIFILTSIAYAKEDGWQLDKAHSHVGFSVRHLGISNVKGEFTDYSAEIQADKNTGKLTGFTGTVKVASVDTGIEKRDDHLRAEDFFAAKTFPVMTLKTKSISFKGNAFSGTGEFTLKGVTKKVTFSGEFLGTRIADFGNGKTKRAGYSLSFKINRQDYNLSFNKLVEGVSVVGDEVTINLEIETFRALN